MVKIIFKLHQICREKTRGLQCLFNEVRKKPVVGFKIIYIFQTFSYQKDSQYCFIKVPPFFIKDTKNHGNNIN